MRDTRITHSITGMHFKRFKICSIPYSDHAAQEGYAFQEVQGFAIQHICITHSLGYAFQQVQGMSHIISGSQIENMVCI